MFPRFLRVAPLTSVDSAIAAVKSSPKFLFNVPCYYILFGSLHWQLNLERRSVESALQDPPVLSSVKCYSLAQYVGDNKMPPTGPSRVSQEQLDKLLTYMEQHRDFALRKPSIHSRFSSSKLWRVVAEELNACKFGTRKSPDKWCRYWADIKYKSRKKTGAPGGCDNLTEFEERMKNIVGVGSVKEFPNRRSSISDEDQKPSLTADESFEDTEPIEQVNLSQAFTEPKLSTEEILAEAAMRSALAAEKQAEAVTQGVELLREFLTTFRQDMTTMQDIAQSLLGRHPTGP